MWTEQKGQIFIFTHACSKILIYDNRGIIYSHSQKKHFKKKYECRVQPQRQMLHS